MRALELLWRRHTQVGTGGRLDLQQLQRLRHRVGKADRLRIVHLDWWAYEADQFILFELACEQN